MNYLQGFNRNVVTGRIQIGPVVLTGPTIEKVPAHFFLSPAVKDDNGTIAALDPALEGFEMPIV